MVQLVGYGFDHDLNKAYWIVRNSWSEAYGEEGYIRLERDTEKIRCGTDTTPLDGSACKGDG